MLWHGPVPPGVQGTDGCCTVSVGQKGGGGMETTKGKSILDRVVAGRLRFCRLVPLRPEPETHLTAKEEELRFRRAQRQAVRDLDVLHDRLDRQVGSETAAIFSAHAMLLEDRDYVCSVCNLITGGCVSAEYAVWEIGSRLAETFAEMDSLYMRARAGDFRDITYRMIGNLRGVWPADPLKKGPAILVSEDFLPSEIMRLNLKRLLGIVTRRGSVDSHTALLLKACGIPSMAEVELNPRWNGHLALMDGRNQRLYLDPDYETLTWLLSGCLGECAATHRTWGC